MTISVKDKIVNGEKDFEYELTFSGDVDYSDILCIYADQYELPSAEVGEYEITGIEIYFYYDWDENNIAITYNTTAVARILPRNYVEITNESYKLNYEYGETVPAPKASDFRVDDGSTLAFAWFKDGVLLGGVPQSAGTYVLRVSASATDEYIASSVEYTVTVQPKIIELVVDPYGECETEIEDLGYDIDDDGKNETRTWYFVEMGESVPIFVVGLPGTDGPVSIEDERFTSTGYYVYWNLYNSDNAYGISIGSGSDYQKVFPDVPVSDGYFIYGYPHSENTFGVASDIAFGENHTAGFYFRINSPVSEIVPIDGRSEYNETGKDIEMVITIPKWDTDIDSDYGDVKINYRTRLATTNDFDQTWFDWFDTSLGYRNENLPIQNIKINNGGVFYVSVTASYTVYTSNGPVEDSEEVLRAKVTVTFTNGSGEVTEIVEAGLYTVKVVTELIDEFGEVIGEGAEHSATYKVDGATRDIYLLVKETEINLDGALPGYNENDVVILPGYNLAPGHKIVDLKYSVELGGYAGAFNMGVITVKDWVIVDKNGNDVSDEYVIHSEMYEWKDKYEEVYGVSFENTKNYTVVHVYSNACDATCNIDGCTKTREAEEHKGGVATCSTRALCEVCGGEYGAYNQSNHSDNKTVYVRNPDDFRYHDAVYACCGAVINTEEHTVTKAATCTTLMECGLCGVVEGSYDAANHASKEMYYATNKYDNTKHDYMHKCCNVTESTGEHKGGTTTCTDLAVCDTCGLGYGNLDADNHSSEEFKYTVITTSTTRHDVSHACCGAYVGTESHFGGTATCTSKAACERCGVEYGDVDPENHASDKYRYSPAGIGGVHYVYNACCGSEIGTEAHSGGTATCTDRALCEKCGALHGELDFEVHASDEVTCSVNTVDSTKHDVIASCCGVVVATEDHSGGEATCTKRASCEHCGTEFGELDAHTYSDVCDADCDVCGAERLPGHVDADKDRVCDRCEMTLGSEGAGDSESEVESEDASESQDELESEDEPEDASESESEDELESEGESEDESESRDELESEEESESVSEDESESPTEDETKSEKPGGDSGASQGGNKKGCRSTLGAGALTVIISVALAGVVTAKKKKED